MSMIVNESALNKLKSSPLVKAVHEDSLASPLLEFSLPLVETDDATCGGTAPCYLSFTSDQIAGLERVYELRDSFNIAAANLSLGGGKSTTE